MNRFLTGLLFSAACLSTPVSAQEDLDVIASGSSVLQRTEDPKTGLRVEPTDKGWEVWQGEMLLAGYLTDFSGTPAIYPLLGPGGKQMTRDYPFTDAGEFEKDDHIHHRSLWFNHGEVNEIDFWSTKKGCGKIVHVSGSAFIENGQAIIQTENDWLSESGKLILSDVRRWAFYESDGRHVIDFDVLLRATGGNVNFGDTKEGSFGIRIPGSMKVTADQGGIMINSDGETNLDAWGKSVPWVDYSGPVDGKTMGIAIHDHPSSFGYPARFHVRTYGLFAANPFGQFHFIGGEKRRGILLPHGKTMQLHYRVILHRGGLDAEVANQDSKAYANDPRPVLESSRAMPELPSGEEEAATDPSNESVETPEDGKAADES